MSDDGVHVWPAPSAAPHVQNTCSWRQRTSSLLSVIKPNCREGAPTVFPFSLPRAGYGEGHVR